MLQIFRRTPTIDFMGRRAIGFAVSGLLVFGSLTLLGWRTQTKGDPVNYGIDFRGGSVFRIRFAGPADEDDIRNRLASAGFSGAVVQKFSEPDDDTVMIRVPENLEASRDLVSRVQGALRPAAEQDNIGAGKHDLNTIGESELAEILELALTGQASKSRDPRYVAIARAVVELRERQPKGMFADLGQLEGHEGVSAAAYEVLSQQAYTGSMAFQSIDSVGPAVGEKLRNRAIFASIVANSLILLYLSMRFEIRFGVAAVITLVHDLIILIGAFVVTDREFELPVLAAVLTVIGYSVNDTIVVFDRIRMNLKVLRKKPLVDVVNTSINQTLGRTVLTSGSTLLVVGPLYLFGGMTLNNFAFALLLGILIGTYSSIFVASPILLLWQRWVVKS